MTRWAAFTEAGPAKAWLGAMMGPWVIKGAGMTSGKGVVVAYTLGEAEAAVDDMLDRFNGRVEISELRSRDPGSTSS